MKDIPKRKGLLVVALIAAMVLTSGLPTAGTSCAADPASNVITFYYTSKADYFTVRVQYIDKNEKFINEERNRAYSAASGSAVTEEAIHFDEYTLSEDEFPVKSVTVNVDHFAYVIGYPDGEVKPLGAITREEVAAIFYRLMTEESRKQYYSASQPFSDVAAGRWSNDGIATLYNAKIVRGNTDGGFEPSKPITRAEFAAIAARFDNLDEVSENMFPDITDHWAKKYINSSAQKGWIRGYGDGTFRPDNIILRCEVMKMINEELDRRVNTAGLCSGIKQWPDNAADKWYYEIVLEATNTHDYERENRPKSTEKWTGIKDNPVW